MYRYCVRKRTDLLHTTIPFFRQYPLRTSKQADFLNFSECVRLIETGAHLTKGGLIEISQNYRDLESPQGAHRDHESPWG
jgi:hypothetical protein